jgi:hypothetical protein
MASRCVAGLTRRLSQKLLYWSMCVPVRSPVLACLAEFVCHKLQANSIQCLEYQQNCNKRPHMFFEHPLHVGHGADGCLALANRAR